MIIRRKTHPHVFKLHPELALIERLFGFHVEEKSYQRFVVEAQESCPHMTNEERDNWAIMNAHLHPDHAPRVQWIRAAVLLAVAIIVTLVCAFAAKANTHLPEDFYVGASAHPQQVTPMNAGGSAGAGSGCTAASVGAHLYCGNDTGAPAAPTFVAIVAADLPGTITSNTSGNAATATALAATPSTCGAGVAAIGVLANGNATGCFTPGGLSNPMTTIGDIIYGASSGTPTRLAANSTATNNFLRSVSSGVPVWAQPTIGDIAAGTTSASYTFNGNDTYNGIESFIGGGSQQGVWTAGPSYVISAVTESGNTVTVTTSTPCSAITATYQSIVVTGVGVSGYNVGSFTVSACAGSTFTYFDPTSGLGASSGGTVVVSPIFTQGLTHTGPETVSGTLTMTNHNQIFWAGPGATPTIDQAVTSCGTNTCVVTISPLYSGPESASLVTNSVGYPVYTGANNITIEDMRANPGTPGNGFSAPVYGVIYGGRLAGQRNRLGVSYYSHNETDSSAGQTSANWVDGTFSSIGGQYAAAINTLVIHDTVTVGSSTSPTVGTDSELHMDAVTADNPLFHAWSYVGQTLVSRNTATQKVQTATVYQAQPCSVIGGATASIANCYGFNGEAPTQGTARNASYHSFGDWMTEAATSWWAADAGTPFTIAASPTGATESGQTVTITVTGGPCTFVTGQMVGISGVTVTGYNGYFTVNSPGCNGTSSFTYFAPGTSALAGSGTGTATGNNMRVVTTWGPGGNNQILNKPLSDTVGWLWTTQAGGNAFRIVPGSIVTSFLPHEFTGRVILDETTAPSGSGTQDLLWGDSTAHKLKANNNNGGAVTFAYIDLAQTWTANQSFNSGTLLPSAAGGTDLGSTSLPFGNLWLGTAATNNFKFQPAATAGARTVSILDPTTATTFLPLLNAPIITGSTNSNVFRVTADFTDASSTALQTITGLSWVLPANTAANYSVECHLSFSQATAVADAFGIQAASLAPTNIYAHGLVQTNATTAFTGGTLATLATTTATNILTFTPTLATVETADLYALVENPSGVANTINIMVSQTTAADVIVVKRGSYCRVY